MIENTHSPNIPFFGLIGNAAVHKWANDHFMVVTSHYAELVNRKLSGFGGGMWEYRIRLRRVAALGQIRVSRLPQVRRPGS